jgi:hypothetical protein
MKRLKSLLAIVTLAAVVTSCNTMSSTQSTEEMLAASGFKVVPANTPQQVAHLKSLPPGKFSTTTRQGTQYWTYPDVANNQLYVGQEAQYQAYQKILQQKRIAEENLITARDSSEYRVWGNW